MEDKLLITTNQTYMKSLRNVATGIWGKFQQLPLATHAASGILLVLVVTLGVLNLPTSNNSTTATSTDTKINPTTQTIGSESEAFATFASWPGEIISPNDADVQPPRQGTIVSWDVSIGEYVRAGQTLGRLSAVPLTPELAATLAGQSTLLAQAKAKAESTRTFVGQSKDQLSTFTSSDTALRAIDEAKQSVLAAKETVRATLRQAVVTEYSTYSGNSRDVLSSTANFYAQTLLWWFGATNSSLRDMYLTAATTVVSALEKNGVPDQEGAEYFLASTRLVSASVANGEAFTQTNLESLRKKITDDQAAFNDAVEKYRAAALTVSEKEKEYAERTRDTSTKLTELDRESIVAQSELEAAEASYSAVSGAITGGTAIIAPKSGYVSAITRQIGEYAEPGNAVASISSGVLTNKIVRFRIPSNVEIPKKGQEVKIIRPGFSKDIRSAIITGVGTGLDGNGSFMADARIDGELEWPAHLSVRVVPEKRTSQTIAVPFEAVFWDEENHPHVWLVGDGGVITSRAVKTGRTFGDAVEILQGLALGDTYVPQASENIIEGMKIEEAAIPDATSTPDGDGHGHTHDE